jgi:hypothetical protein
MNDCAGKSRNFPWAPFFARFRSRALTIRPEWRWNKSCDSPDIHSLHNEACYEQTIQGLPCVFLVSFSAQLFPAWRKSLRIPLRPGAVGDQTQLHVGQRIRVKLTFETDGTQSCQLISGFLPFSPAAGDLFRSFLAFGLEQIL